MRNIIETPFGKTELNIFGNGPPILVIHGGPGFSHNYLVEGLLPLAEKRCLIFYDQPSYQNQSGSNKHISALNIFSHFRWLASKLSENEPLGIIAHSWGSLVFIAGLVDTRLQTSPSPNLSRILLMNSMPVTAKSLNAARTNLMRRLTWVSKTKLVLKIVSNASGQNIMKELLPYYVYDNSCIPLDEFKLDKKIYVNVLKQLKSYDFLKELEALPEFNLLLSEHDFITSSHLEPLIEIANNHYTIKSSAHFPMWENPEEFHKVTRSVFF